MNPHDIRQIALLFTSALTLSGIVPFFTKTPNVLKTLTDWQPIANFSFYPVRFMLLILLLWQTRQPIEFAIFGALTITALVEFINLLEDQSEPTKAEQPSKINIDKPPRWVVPSAQDLIDTEKKATRKALKPAIKNEPKGGHQGLNPLVSDYTAAASGNPAIGHYNPYVNR